MSNPISTFNFKSNPVRIETINNEPYFALKDVCLALAIQVASPERFSLDPQGVTLNVIPTTSGNQELTFINEPNLYRIIFKSRKTEAVEFQNWVFEEVLPQIRKTGQYALPQAPIDPTLTLELKQSELRNLLNVWHLFHRFTDSTEPLLKKSRRFIHGNDYSLPEYLQRQCKQAITQTQPLMTNLLTCLPKEQPPHFDRNQLLR